MKIEEFKEKALPFLIWIGMVVLVWVCAKYFADSISEYEVIEPEPGVKCVIVSRAFNTSVSCYTK